MKRVYLLCCSWSGQHERLCGETICLVPLDTAAILHIHLAHSVGKTSGAFERCPINELVISELRISDLSGNRLLVGKDFKTPQRAIYLHR